MEAQAIGSVRFVAVSATIPNLQASEWSFAVLGACMLTSHHAGLVGATCLDRTFCLTRLQDLAEWLDVPRAGIKCFGEYGGAIPALSAANRATLLLCVY